MTANCRPPPGTPDGTVCVLKWRYEFDFPMTIVATWHRRKWWAGGDYWVLPWQPMQCVRPYQMGGWRFHSIAEPPADEVADAIRQRFKQHD